jgi:hypothetical protein
MNAMRLLNNYLQLFKKQCDMATGYNSTKSVDAPYSIAAYYLFYWAAGLIVYKKSVKDMSFLGQ